MGTILSQFKIPNNERKLKFGSRSEYNNTFASREKFPSSLKPTGNTHAQQLFKEFLERNDFLRNRGQQIEGP